MKKQFVGHIIGYKASYPSTVNRPSEGLDHIFTLQASSPVVLTPVQQ